AIHFFLVRQRYHEKFVTLVKADHAVGKYPHAVEERIAAENPTHWCARDADGIYDLREERRAHRTTKGAEQGRADILCHLALELDAFAFGFVQLTRGDARFLLLQILVELFARLFQSPNRQRRMSEPMRMRA